MLMRTIAKWVIGALGVLAAGYLLPNYVSVAGFGTAFLVALVLGFINAFIRPVLLILTLPINIITLGLFTFIVNGFCFWAASFVKGFTVKGFWGAVLGALIVSVISWTGDRLIEGAKED
jgi:putative membrane protein